MFRRQCSWKIKVSFVKKSGISETILRICRLVDRYLIDGYSPQRLSTYALNLFRHRTTLNDEKILIGNLQKYVFENLRFFLILHIHLTPATVQVQQIYKLYSLKMTEISCKVELTGFKMRSKNQNLSQ